MLERTEPETVIGIFPSDHVVANVERFSEVIRAGVALAAKGENIIVLGVPPTRPETGYGYIEQGQSLDLIEGTAEQPVSAFRVKRFREKPDKTTAERFWLREILLGMAGSFFGVRGRWRTRFGNTRPIWHRS